jgi:LuxR family maltose regulon positive regulatory protein
MKQTNVMLERGTNLYTRRYFEKIMKKFISESKREKKYFSLLLLGIDNFNTMYDKYGYSISNKIFSHAAKILKQSVRSIDICFRYDSDEIAIILPNALKEVAENIIMRLKTKIETYAFSIDGKERLYIGLSIGMAVFPDDGLKYPELIGTAQVALSHAKHQKKNRLKPFVLKTKLTLPSLKESTISRSQLISLFENNRKKKLFLVVADAGYGKTTLLAHVVHNLNWPFVYYGMDREDSNLAVFLSYLMHGLELFQPHLVERTHRLLQGGTDKTDNYELILKTLVNELVEKTNQDLFIILDDYHTILDASLVHEALDYFVNHVPPHVHVIIAARVIPPLSSLAKWRAKQDLFELSRDDLRFTKDEITVLFNNVYRMMLSHEELKRIFKHTEGWITGIQLIVQSADKRRNTVKEILNGYVAANQPLFGYFANEILAWERSEVREFLIRSSVLEIMTPHVCDMVLKRKNSARLLRDMEKRNLFLSTHGKEEYRYHHLFREFLQKRLEDEKLKKSLNLQAAKFYRQKKQMEQAVQHYLAAENYEWAAKIIIQISEHIESQARQSILTSWLNHIPEKIYQKYPRLLTLQGNLLRSQGKLQEAKEKYTLSEHRLMKRGDKSGLVHALLEHACLFRGKAGDHKEGLKILRRALRVCPDSREKLKIDILNLMGILWFYIGNLHKVKSCFVKAYRLAEQINSTKDLNTIESNLAALLDRQGERRLAFQSFTKLIERMKETYCLEDGVIYANAAVNAVNLGNVEWAEQCLNTGWNRCQHYDDPLSKAMLYQGFGILYRQKMDWSRAEKYLLKALNEFKKLQWEQSEIATLRNLCRLYRYQGEFSKCENYLKQIRQKVTGIETLDGVAYLTQLVFLQICLKQFERAEKNTKIILKLAQNLDFKIHIFFSLLAAAVIHLHKNKNRMAAASLRRAFRLAKTKGYDGVVLSELWHLPQLARFAEKYSTEKNYLLSLNLPRSKPRLQLHVYCLGSLRLEDSAGKILSLAWPTVKAKSLFSFLIAYHETPVHREFLIEQLWPDVPKSRASINFRTTATRMRQSLFKALFGTIPQNEIFVCRRMRYQLLPQCELRLDTEEFDLLIKEAERVESEAEKAKIIKQALNLYKGNYLSDIYDSWTDAFRRLLYERRLSALHWLAQYTARQGDDFACIEVCESYLSIDPFSEEVVRIYMKCLARLGRIETVKVLYKSLKHTLHKELHYTPAKETEDLYLSIVDSRAPV